MAWKTTFPDSGQSIEARVEVVKTLPGERLCTGLVLRSADTIGRGPW